MKLFLIDDNELVRSSLSGLLRDLYPQIHLSCFASCEAALASLEEQVHFVLLDFHLHARSAGDHLINVPNSFQPTAPHISQKLEAWACLTAIQKRFSKARIILISAEPTRDMFTKARALGAHAFIEKSVRPAVMLKEIREALDARH